MQSTKLARRRCSAVSSALLRLQRVGQVGAEPGDFSFTAREEIGDVLLGVGGLLLDRLEGGFLNKRAPHERLVLACAPRGGEAAVTTHPLCSSAERRLPRSSRTSLWGYQRPSDSRALGGLAPRPADAALRSARVDVAHWRLLRRDSDRRDLSLADARPGRAAPRPSRRRGVRGQGCRADRLPAATRLDAPR